MAGFPHVNSAVSLAYPFHVGLPQTGVACCVLAERTFLFFRIIGGNCAFKLGLLLIDSGLVLSFESAKLL